MERSASGSNRATLAAAKAGIAEKNAAKKTLMRMEGPVERDTVSRDSMKAVLTPKRGSFSPL
jgi:hypothetical protein